MVDKDLMAEVAHPGGHITVQAANMQPQFLAVKVVRDREVVTWLLSNVGRTYMES